MLTQTLVKSLDWWMRHCIAMDCSLLARTMGRQAVVIVIIIHGLLASL